MHSSVYLPEAVYEALREAAFRERCKIHDIVLEGIRLALSGQQEHVVGFHTATEAKEWLASKGCKAWLRTRGYLN